MVIKNGYLLLLLAGMQAGTMLCAVDAQRQGEMVLTPEQASRIAQELEVLLQEAHQYDQQNRAPRPDAAQPCDGVFPACASFDLTMLSECCGSIKSMLCCLGTSIIDVLGSCEDLSTLLPSVADKSDIDALCISTVSLLKTILLELRGAFLSV
jgi:hypothetical protein